MLGLDPKEADGNGIIVWSSELLPSSVILRNIGRGFKSCNIFRLLKKMGQKRASLNLGPPGSSSGARTKARVNVSRGHK